MTKQGFLYKKGQIIRQWKCRFFVIGDGKLRYYKTQEEFTEKRKPLGEIDISIANRVQRATPMQCDGREFGFILTTPGRSYVLCADSETSLADWTRILDDLIKLRKHQLASRPLISGQLIKVRCVIRVLLAH